MKQEKFDKIMMICMACTIIMASFMLLILCIVASIGCYHMIY
jgi:hypothetical protein